MGTTKKKRVRKVSSKKLKVQNPMDLDFLTDAQKKALASEETLFPEKLKRANETMKYIKLPDYFYSNK